MQLASTCSKNIAFSVLLISARTTGATTLRDCYAWDCRNCDKACVVIRLPRYSAITQQPLERSGLEVQGRTLVSSHRLAHAKSDRSRARRSVPRLLRVDNHSGRVPRNLRAFGRERTAGFGRGQVEPRAIKQSFRQQSSRDGKAEQFEVVAVGDLERLGRIRNRQVAGRTDLFLTALRGTPQPLQKKTAKFRWLSHSLVNCAGAHPLFVERSTPRARAHAN